MTNLTELHRRAKVLTTKINATEKAHKELMDKLGAERGKCRQQIRMAGAALDLDKIALAESLIYVRGQYSNAGEDRAYALNKAIGYLIDNSGAPLWRCYLGTKSYDRWHGQSIEPEYGMGPTHGSVIFAIGVQSDVRKSREAGSLTPDEIEACLYYLSALEIIQKAKAEAA